MAINEDVKYTITLNDMMSGKLKSIDNEAKGLNVSMKNLVMGGIAGLATFAAGDFIKGSVEAFNESAQASAQLDASLKSTGNAAGLSREALDKQSEALMRMSLFDDDAITKSQGLLATFTNIKDKVYMDAVPAITDLATKMGGDLQGATIQVGKALNDPIKGITALSRVGVSFSEDQKKVIKTLVDTGKTAEAQKMILAELNKEFGGSAKASAEAGTGGLTVLQHEFGNVREEIGELVMGIVNGLKPAMRGLVDLFKQSVKWIKENKTGLKAVAVGVGVLTTAYGIYMAQSKMVSVYEALKKTAFFQTAIAEGGLVAVQNALNASMLANPIVWVVAGLAALAAGFYYAWEKSETFRAGVMGVWEVVKTYVGLMVDYWTGLWHVVHGAFTLDKGEVEKGLLTIKDTIFNAGEKLGNAWQEGKEKGVASFKDSKKEKKKGDGLIAGVDPMGSPEAAAASAGTPKAPKAPSAQANKAITINVTIGKLIETFKIQTNNMSESTSKIKEMVASTLTDALNDSQIVAGI